MKKFLGFFEKGLPFFSVVGLISGISISSVSIDFEHTVNSAIGIVIEYYSYVAPIAIYFILAPSLCKILFSEYGDGKKFVGYATFWLSIRKLLACLWGTLFTTIIFGLPFVSGGGSNVIDILFKTVNTFIWMMFHSTYFYAVYLAIITVFLCRRFKRLESLMNKIADAIEGFGPYIVPFIPLFMIAIGSYIYALPANLKDQISYSTLGSNLGSLRLFIGNPISGNSPMGMIGIYIIGALLTGIACFIWHFGLLFAAKIYDSQFSITNYFRNYWCRVYPLLWATGSESLATPLNLHLVQKYYSDVRSEVRRLIVGMGSFLNINGTIICVFVMLGVVSSLIGFQLSFVQLLACIPVVFIISYGVPGIPGELLLFAGPLSMLLVIPDSMTKAFLTLYLGLQIGLPDSFRTGNNSTDNCVLSIMLNKIYEKKFFKKGGEMNHGK